MTPASSTARPASTAAWRREATQPAENHTAGAHARGILEVSCAAWGVTGMSSPGPEQAFPSPRNPQFWAKRRRSRHRQESCDAERRLLCHRGDEGVNGAHTLQRLTTAAIRLRPPRFGEGCQRGLHPRGKDVKVGGRRRRRRPP